MNKILLFLFLLPGIFFFNPAQSQDGKEVALETIGVLSATVVYNSYLSIGSLADSYAAEVYDKDQIKALMQEQISAMQILSDQCSALLATDFLTTEDDRLFFQETIQCIDYLKMQATAFNTYVDSGLQGDGEAYDHYRESAWTLITKIVGIE